MFQFWCTRLKHIETLILYHHQFSMYLQHKYANWPLPGLQVQPPTKSQASRWKSDDTFFHDNYSLPGRADP